ncbi:lipoprotein [Cnuibacter physcomitrellae]|uniref:PbrT family lead (Pb2+) uptake porter n=1 Tax=Cnuibacter physcomitrellae TaxID=1619308 RepID=A0A1X9LT49_9MICO|nr:iron uptake system protein EfeO [Cnuibacter physcomitrellae]ARJ07592.1 PbrT family lead (Pb2+) uptake porter [Cnuibacter physcomitrellae]GGI42342.1 lipoprotein [Cnuibacter physcomitrellae]
MTARTPFRRLAVAPIALTGVVLAGCVANTPAGGSAGGGIAVTSSSTDCAVGAASAPSGPVTFTVTNSGDQVTEFYLLADDGLRIVGEIENIGPGISRDLVVQAQPGDYFTVCKPGMVGDGIGKTVFTVTGDTVQLPGTLQEQVDAAAANYVAYVKDQVAQLVVGTQDLATAYAAGDVATAQALYPRVRANYERIEPVASSFSDIDPALDAREADVAQGEAWTGWHRIEKDLFPPAAADNGGVTYVALTAAERSSYADRLVADTQALADAVNDPSYTLSIDAISNGAIALLEEVASGKITGEEEIWSHTDLWDFQANLEGARVAYEGVRDIAAGKDPALVATLDQRFAELEATLSRYGNLQSGFASYTDLTPAQVKELADGVNSLSEPLSRLTATLVS